MVEHAKRPGFDSPRLHIFLSFFFFIKNQEMVLNGTACEKIWVQFSATAFFSFFSLKKNQKIVLNRTRIRIKNIRIKFKFIFIWMHESYFFNIRIGILWFWIFTFLKLILNNFSLNTHWIIQRKSRNNYEIWLLIWKRWKFFKTFKFHYKYFEFAWVNTKFDHQICGFIFS